MADDLEENFEIGDEFMPSARPQEVNISEEEEEEIEEVNKPTTNKRKQAPTAEAPSKKKKRKNITEILELKKSEMSKASFATREFIKILSEYAQKKLSGVEKNELNLGGDIDSRLGDMILKRKKTHRLEVGEQFKKKFVKKLRSHKKAQTPSRDRRSPFIVVLAQSAVRCIDLHKQISSSLPPNLMGSLNWLYAFAKHKKLAEQVTFINEKFKRDEKYSLDIVYATPQRFKQLVDAGCLSTKSVEFVFVDYSFRDVKLKRIVDHNEIRADLSDLVYKCFLPVNAAADRICLKFYLA